MDQNLVKTCSPKEAPEDPPKKNNDFPKYKKKKAKNVKIEAHYIGKFINDSVANQVHPENFEWRHLHEPTLRKKPIKLDLHHNIETFKTNPFHDGKIDPLLNYIVQTSQKGSKIKEAVHECDFVTNRGSLVKIASSAYLNSYRDKWQIVCCKFKEVIFMYERTTEEKRQNQENASFAEKCGIYRGHKFEQYLMSDCPNSEPDIEEPVSTLTPQYGVFKSQSTDHNGSKMSFLINAEIDGKDKSGKFVELKTRKIPYGKNYVKPSWYFSNMSRVFMQSYLVGIERLIFGIVDKSGVVTRLEELKTTGIKEVKKEWNHEDCLKRLFAYLNQVRVKLEGCPERTLLQTDLDPTSGQITFKTVKEEHRDQFEFLPDHFIEHFNTD